MLGALLAGLRAAGPSPGLVLVPVGSELGTGSPLDLVHVSGNSLAKLKNTDWCGHRAMPGQREGLILEVLRTDNAPMLEMPLLAV